MTIREDFQDVLMHNFRAGPNIESLLDILSPPFQDLSDALDFLDGSFDIDTAAGDQLNILGERIGVTRPKRQEDPENIFTLMRLGEANDPDNDRGFYDATDGTGGYMVAYDGLDSITNPGDMSDDDYRAIIKQKASSYRQKMRRENLFNYLIEFGAQCQIDDDTTFEVNLDMFDGSDLSQWAKHYVETKGFKPAGIKVNIFTTRHQASI